MKEQEIYNHQLAIRYFEGRITPSEEEILFRFVNDAPSNERMFRQWEEVATPDAGASIAEWCV